MSMADVDALVAKAQADPNFFDALYEDFDGAAAKQGFSLTPDERLAAQKKLTTKADPASLDFRQIQDDLRERAKQSNEQVSQLKTSAESLFQETMQRAKSTFKLITLMNQIMFGMGVVLFLAGAVCAIFFRNLPEGAVFAGLGTVTFVSLFLLGPIDKTQAALAHLIQAQIAFMSYYEQLYFIERYAGLPNSQNLPDPDRLAEASDMMQDRCAEMMQLLGTYLDKRPVSVRPKRTVRPKRQGAKPSSGAAISTR